MGLLSENRKEEGLLLNRDLADNLTTILALSREQDSLRVATVGCRSHRIELQVKTRGLRHVGEF